MCPVRNWVARSPLLRKGGAHTRSTSADRFSTRNRLRDAIDEWFDDLETEAAEQPDINAHQSKQRRRAGPSGPDSDYTFPQAALA